VSNGGGKASNLLRGSLMNPRLRPKVTVKNANGKPVGPSGASKTFILSWDSWGTVRVMQPMRRQTFENPIE